jgi:hypothetical protein
MKVNWKLEIGKVKELAKSGYTLQRIGDIYGVSRSRMNQVYKEYLPELLADKEKGASLRVLKRKELRDNEIKTLYGRDSYHHTSDLSEAQAKAYTRKKQNNKASGKWEWEIVLADITFPSVCPYLGLELDWFSSFPYDNSPSFDRVDTSKGYIKGNVIVCSSRANRIKNNASSKELFKIAYSLQEMGY